MNMQDKEFDNLFRSKLDGVEIEPSAQVWDNIAINLGHKKRSIVPLLRIAASVVVVLTAGTWLAVRQSSNQPKKINSQVAHVKKVQPVVLPKADNTTTIEVPTVQAATNTVLTNRLAVTKKKSVEKTTPVTSPNTIPANAKGETIISKPEQVLAAVVEPAKSQPVLPEVPLTVKSLDAEQPQPKSVNTQAIANLPEKKAVKKRGIRSLGDLINVVVAKVDKREDKLIEFTDTDDDQATITGINLGIIKVKKEK